MASVADVLEKAADLIEPEGAWTQGAFARDADGNRIGLSEANAACFCARGAIYRVADRSSVDKAEDFFARKVLGKDDGYTALTITEYNDAPERTQAEVVAKLREAAALAREREL